jgi:uncharacterized protein
MERRLIATELRAVADAAEKRTIAGYAAVFNKLSVVMYDWFEFREEIAPGAFAGSLEKNDIRALWNHDPAQVLGRTTNGTLRMAEDDTGLAFELDLPDTQVGRDAYTLIKRGDVSGMSFGFRMVREGYTWSIDAAGTDVCRLTNVDLVEVSPVTFPAYPDTQVYGRASIDGEKMPDYVRQVAERNGVDSEQAAVTRARLQAMTELDLQLATRRLIREG